MARHKHTAGEACSKCGQTVRRKRNREFPRGISRCTIAADWAPPSLKAAALKKAEEEGTALRTVILRQLKRWTGWTPPPPASGASAR
jgi:hypothetical protein